MTSNSERTFEEASRSIQASLQRHLDNYKSRNDSTSSDDDDEDRLPTIRDEVLSSVFGSYDNGDRERISESRALIKDSFPGSCLICLSSVKRQERIWNCSTCHNTFHLGCIQRWAKDSLFQLKSAAESQGKKLDLVHWCCPKCRSQYASKDIPVHYYCFCGQQRDPEADPWLVPHSCGEICGRSLKPDCGHSCTLLCHPGPCPPCPKVISEKCHCGQSAPAIRRCYSRLWSCNKRCNKKLSCGLHPCPEPCHGGECAPCKKTSVQVCFCKRHQGERDCSEPEWKCSEKCLKPLSCGHHKCDIVCHAGECRPCTLSLLRTCPCGKNSYKLDCTLATPTCGDTCDKKLSCGRHACSERCHRGDCGRCFQTIPKRCKCGSKTRDFPCTKEYLCDVKCKNPRDCGKHACNKKCCDGTACLPCEQICNKTLSCKNHKCHSVCHTGVCYPCSETKKVSCYCGSSQIVVPCGMEKTSKIPKCKNKCSKAGECHHGRIQEHKCHYGLCPPCNLPCGRTMACSHVCASKCHDRVRVKVANKNAAGPWEVNEVVETRSLECPSCPEPVIVGCLGQHDEASLPCHAAKVTSCGRLCDRRLPCGNHSCQRKCHKVKNAESADVAGSNCQKCEAQCEKPRPPGCAHKCPKTCHPESCGECRQMIWIRCFCGINKLYLNCAEWSKADEVKKDVIGSCKDQCPKILNCGHRCPQTCHSSKCPTYELCIKKVKLSCACKTIKREYVCSSLKLTERLPIECDSNCKSKEGTKDTPSAKTEDLTKETAVSAAYESNREKRNRNRARNRRSETRTDELSFFVKYKKALLAGSIIVGLVSMLTYYVIL